MTCGAVGARRFASPVNVTSGCSSSTTAATSPDAIAASNFPTTSACSSAGFGAPATVRRARDASWRAAAGVTPSTSAISENGIAKPSCSTNATR